MPAPKDRDGYRFAIICAMPVERDAVEDVLDLDYLDSTDQRDVQAVKSYGKEAWDTNAYIYGELAGKPVVLVTSPGIGTLNVTVAATSLRNSFPNIAVALLVGITAGCPFTASKYQHGQLEQTGIRLGDVVISKSMLEYDSGKQYENDFETNTEHDQRLPKAAALVRSYIISIEGESRAFDRLSKATNVDITRHPRLKAAKYRYPGRAFDHIYPAHVQHRCPGSCSSCDKDEGICPIASVSTCEQLGCQSGQYPKGQDRNESKIFIGAYVAGSGVMKSARRRQQLVGKHDALAIEMEGAGVWAVFPTIVVKAVVDYADSHKNKIWRNYPAARAALCAKGIVEALVPPPLPATTSIPTNAAPQATSSASKGPSVSVGDLRRWLNPPDSSTDHFDAQKKRTPGTGQWLLDLKTYQSWLTGPPKVLWLHGKVGSSKTVLCSTITEDIRAHLRGKLDLTAHFAYFYFSFRDSTRQSYQSLLLSVISQLLITDFIPIELTSAYEQNQKHPAILEEALIAILSSSEIAYLVVDALDECPEDNCNRGEIMSGLRSLKDACPNLRVLMSSRGELDIKYFMQRWSSSILELEARSVDADITTYVDVELARHATLARLLPGVKDQIRQVLTTKSDGMFRWVYCQMETLRRLKFPSGHNITRALQDLPRSLDETYERVLQNFNQLHEVKTALRWLAFREGTLTVRALREACLVNHDARPYLDEASRSAAASLIESMSSLIQIQGQEVMLGHQSVKEYLVSERIRSSCAAAFYLSEPQSLHLIAQDCVAYLLHCLDAFREEYEAVRKSAITDGTISHFWPIDATTSATEIISQPVNVPMSIPEVFQRRYPLLAQACSWILYQRAAESLLDTDLDQGLHQVLLARPSVIRFWIAVSPDSILGGDLLVTSLSTLSPNNSDLIVAASVGLVRTVQAMLNMSRAEPIGTQDLALALAGAACYGHYETVKLLLVAGADPNSVVTGVEHQALFNGTSRQVDVAPTSSPTSALSLNRHSSPVLVCACQRGHIRVVEVLLSAKAKPDLSDDTEGTALQIACETGDVAMVELLLRFQADHSLSTKFRNTALSIACGDGFQGTALRTPEQQDQYVSGSKLSLSAARYWLQQRIARLLLAFGADPNFAGHDGRRPLQIACEQWSREIIHILLDAKASPVLVSENGGSLLQTACLKDDQDVVRRLLELGEDPNGRHRPVYRQDMEGPAMHQTTPKAQLGSVAHATPLQIACDRWRRCLNNDVQSIIRQLLAHGANPNVINEEYASPLQYVGGVLTVRESHQDAISMVEALLHCGASPNLLAGAEPPVLQSACEAADEDMVAWLLSMGTDVDAALRHSQRRGLSRVAYFQSKTILCELLRIGVSSEDVIAGDALWTAVHMGPTDNVALLLTGSNGVRVSPDAISTRSQTALDSILDWPSEDERPADDLWDSWTWSRISSHNTMLWNVQDICNEMLARAELLLTAGADVTKLRSCLYVPDSTFNSQLAKMGRILRSRQMFVHARDLALLLASHGARDVYIGIRRTKSVPEEVLLGGRMYKVEKFDSQSCCSKLRQGKTHGISGMYYAHVTDSQGRLLSSQDAVAPKILDWGQDLSSEPNSESDDISHSLHEQMEEFRKAVASKSVRPTKLPGWHRGR